MQLLGQVRSVRPNILTVSLPHNLTGFAPASAVSAELGAAVADAQEAGGSAAAGADGDDAPHTSLSDVFQPGQVVQCVVVKLAPESSKRRIQLSLLPERVNAGRSLDTLQGGQTLVASVKSVEDHGYVMHTGIATANAFMPFSRDDSAAGDSDAGDDADSAAASRHRVGDLLTCVVSDVTHSSHTVKLSADPASVRKAQLKALPRKAVVPFPQVKPGMLVNSRVLRVISNGVYVQLLGVFTGTVDFFHLLQPATAGWKQGYSEGQRLRCRVLFVDLTSKTIGLSAAPHVVKLQAVQFDGVRACSDLCVSVSVCCVSVSVCVLCVYVVYSRGPKRTAWHGHASCTSPLDCLTIAGALHGAFVIIIRNLARCGRSPWCCASTRALACWWDRSFPRKTMRVAATLRKRRRRRPRQKRRQARRPSGVERATCTFLVRSTATLTTCPASSKWARRSPVVLLVRASQCPAAC